MSLSDAKIRAAAAIDHPYKLSDGNGLFLLVTEAGNKLWKFKYRYAGKEKSLSFGAWPELGLRDARLKRDEAKRKIGEGIDPGAEKQKQKAAAKRAEKSFEDVAREWHRKTTPKWTPFYANQVIARLEQNLFPKIGTLAIDEIEPPTILDALQKVEERGVFETTHRLKQLASRIFCFGIASGYCRFDPASPLGKALQSQPKQQHYKRLSRREVGEFMLQLDAYDGEPLTRIALKLVMLLVPRTTELRAARWVEFEETEDPKNALWRIPEERMKMDTEHLVPLSHQALRLLEELRQLTGKGEYLFPGERNEVVMSNNTMLFALYRMGYKGRTTTHGFRGLFSTETNEKGFKEDWIERQLAHDERNKVRGAYNAAQYMPHRRRMLQWWADELDGLKAAALKKRNQQGGVQIL